MNLFLNNRREKFAITDDLVFHMIYGQGTEESKQALIALLNTVTGEETPIKDIQILNPIDYRKREDYKQVEFDIKLKTDAGDLFDVEMEKRPDRYFPDRCVLYITKLCDRALDKGKDYDIMLSTAIERKFRADEQHMFIEETKDAMRRVTMVSFVKGRLPKSTDSYHTVFSIKDETGRRELSDKMRFHFIEIDKVDETMNISEMTPLERISLYFRYANDPNNERLLHSLIDSGEEAIVLAENIFKRLTADDIAYERMEAREKFIHRYQTDLFLAREDGVMQGRNEGLEQGKIEGEASGRAERELEMAKAMKAESIDIDTIAKVSGLSVEEIEKL